MKRACTYVIALAVALCLPALSSCKESDAIVERVLDPNSPNIDFNNPDKLYIPDDSAKITVEDLDVDLEEVKKQDQIQKDQPTQENQSKNDASVATPTLDKTSGKNNGAAASGKGGKGNGASSEGSNKSNKNGGGGGKKKDDGSEEPAKSPDPSPKSDYPIDPSNDDYQDRVYDSTYGRTEKLPDDVTTVAATGELATVTLMLGNEGALVGSSSDYLLSKAVKNVFASKGTSKAEAVWQGNGEKTTDDDARKIIELNPSALLVFSGQLSAKQERMIGQNAPNIKIITLPAPTSPDAIRTEVKAIGRLLTTSTDGASKSLADDYLDFVDDVVSTAMQAHGGGVSTYDGVDYGNPDASKTATAANVSSKAKWTLYVSDWDEDATATATYEDAKIFKDQGAAYTNVGWSWSPLSYYMSAGGAINNAAAFGPRSSKAFEPVLQFNQNQVSYSWSKLDIAVDESKGGGSFSDHKEFNVLLNARDGLDTASGVHLFGSSDFNVLITRNSAIKSQMESALEESNGLYTPYGHIDTASGSGYGKRHEGKFGESIIYSTIKGGSSYKILVNPCGYLGSWTSGSVEAPLESLWIANQFWDLPKSVLEDRITAFYKKFYNGYEPNVSKILKGDYETSE